MAFTVLASWDFRGADSAATKRVARIGGYTLTEEGTPSWSADGVDCSGAGGRRLRLTLPPALKVSPSWFIAGFRIMNATAPVELTNIVGLRDGASTSLYDASMMLVRKPANTSTRVAFSPSGSDTFDAGVTLGVADHICAVRNPGVSPSIGVRINNDAWDNFALASINILYTATTALMFGTPDSEDVRTRYHWFIMGSGAITDAEVQAMYDNPNAYIYSGGGANKFRPYFITG
jgi:hypothetical protein